MGLSLKSSMYISIQFFSKRRLEKIHTPETLFSEISGFELKDDNGPAVLDKVSFLVMYEAPLQ